VLSAPASAAGEALGLDLADHLTAEGAKGEPGEAHTLPTLGRLPVRALLLYGAAAASGHSGSGSGTRAGPDVAVARRCGAVVARRAGKAAHVAVALPEGSSADAVAAFAEGVLLGSYTLDSRKQEPKPSPLRTVRLYAGDEPSDDALRTARVRSTAVRLARDLANEPSLEKTPEWLAARAVKVAKQAGLTTSVMEPAELAERGFGGILAVGSGSTRPPRLIRLDYRPEGKATRKVVLIGKGITFDSGGLSIKPNDGMAAMKTDMSGGAAVVAAMQALPALGVRARVTGLVAAAENMPSGTAMRPGDVIRHYGGRTVEVLNTDAEGRLVLADALAHAVTDLRPDHVVDLATLTGAIGIALGKRTAGLFSNDDALANALLGAADEAGERFWRMPLVDDYRPDLDSPVADMKNIGGRFGAGSIIAALFLREFVGTTSWAHLDIAGAARSDNDEDEISKGGTGFGVRTLLSWLGSL
jgi:leucyl aminopeptidase